MGKQLKITQPFSKISVMKEHHQIRRADNCGNGANRENRTTNELKGCRENVNHKARTSALTEKVQSKANNIKRRELFELLIE